MKQYRQDAHIVSVIHWGSLWAAAAGSLLLREMQGPPGMAGIALGAALLIVGLAIPLLYSWRAHRLWTAVLPDKGLAFAGRGVILWEDIRRIERRRPLLAR